MKTSNKKKYSFAALLLLLIRAKAWLAEVMALLVIFLAIVGAIWYVIHKLFPLPPQPSQPANPTNTMTVIPGVQETYEWPNWPAQYLSLAPSGGSQGIPLPGQTFSFQYGFTSFNPTAPLWSAPGTSRVITNYWPNTDPNGINNPTWQLTNNSYVPYSVLASPVNNSNCWDMIYQCDGWLYHFQSTNVLGTNVINFNNNLVLVVNGSTDMKTWVPLFTNGLVGADIPYTFTDNQAVEPWKYYRVDAY